MQVIPYLFFDGRCEEAFDFYARCWARRSRTHAFKASADRAGCPPDSGDKVMHASFRIGDSVLMASDGHGRRHAPVQGRCAVADSPSTSRRGERMFARWRKAAT